MLLILVTNKLTLIYANKEINQKIPIIYYRKMNKKKIQDMDKWLHHH